MKPCVHNDFHAFVDYYITLLADQELLETVWKVYPADYWLEDLLETWGGHEQEHALVDSLIEAVDEILDDLCDRQDLTAENLIPTIFSHRRWQDVQTHAQHILNETST